MSTYGEGTYGEGLYGGGVSAYVIVHPDCPEVAVDIDFDNNPTSETRTWTSVSDRLREVHVRVYRATEIDEFQIGALTCVLSNDDRELEPNHLGSSYFPNVAPRRPIRYRARWDGVEYERFWGITRSHSIHWPGQVDAVTVIDAADIGMLLNRDQVQLNGYPEETVDDRINRVLDDIGVPAGVRDIDTSDAYVAAVDEESESVQAVIVGALQHCQEAARSDGGYFFVSVAGDAVFHNRYHRRDVLGTPSAVFGDAGDGTEVPYRPDLVGEADDIRLWNRATVITAGGDREEATNPASIERYWSSRRDDFQSLLAYPADAMARASLYVWRYSQEEPELRFPRLSVKAIDIPGADIPALLAADVGTRFEIIRRPPGGGAEIDQEAHVEGITEDVNVNGAVWELGYDVSPADPDQTVWALGTGELAYGDDFEDGTLDTATWTLSSDADVDFLETGGAAQFTIDTTGSGTSTVTSVETTLSMSGRQVLIDLESAGTQQSTTFARMFFRDTATSYIAFSVSNGTLTAYRNTGAGDSNVATATYDATLHRWLRMRHDSTVIRWEYAPARGGPWQELGSLTTPITITSGDIQIQGDSSGTPAAQTIVRYGWFGLISNTVPANLGY